jgi:hypothetical protein
MKRLLMNVEDDGLLSKWNVLTNQDLMMREFCPRSTGFFADWTVP